MIEQPVRDGANASGAGRGNSQVTKECGPEGKGYRNFNAILGQGARLPSQRRFAARARTAAEGISLSSSEVEQLDRLLERGLDAV